MTMILMIILMTILMIIFQLTSWITLRVLMKASSVEISSHRAVCWLLQVKVKVEDGCGAQIKCWLLQMKVKMNIEDWLTGWHLKSKKGTKTRKNQIWDQLIFLKEIKIWKQSKSLKSESWWWVWCSNKIVCWLLQRGQRTFTILEGSESGKSKWKWKWNESKYKSKKHKIKSMRRSTWAALRGQGGPQQYLRKVKVKSPSEKWNKSKCKSKEWRSTWAALRGRRGPQQYLSNHPPDCRGLKKKTLYTFSSGQGWDLAGILVRYYLPRPGLPLGRDTQTNAATKSTLMILRWHRCWCWWWWWCEWLCVMDDDDYETFGMPSRE